VFVPDLLLPNVCREQQSNNNFMVKRVRLKNRQNWSGRLKFIF
jgi:hypothetical protein